VRQRSAHGRTLGTEHAPILFDLVETLTRERASPKWMKENGMLEMAKAGLLSCELNDTNRPKFIRIRIRLLSVKSSFA
jgi:hypothetical protein